VTDWLFCLDRGVKYTTNDTFRKGVVSVIHEHGISKLYKGNSVQHPTINAAIGIMKTMHGVNAYTRHSHKATAVLDVYYHQNENWAGLRLSQLSGAGTKIVPVLEDAQEMMDNDDAEAAVEGEDDVEGETTTNSWPLESRSHQRDSTAQGRENRENKEARNAGPRAGATGVVAAGAGGLQRPGLVVYRAIGLSTTRAEVGLTSSSKMRRVGGCTNVACHYGASSYSSIYEERGRPILASARPIPSKAGVCPPKTEARGSRRKEADADQDDEVNEVRHPSDDKDDTGRERGRRSEQGHTRSGSDDNNNDSKIIAIIVIKKRATQTIGTLTNS
jgi:hypothetical protein